MPDKSEYFSAGTWKSLPLAVRQAWWQDTDYGRRPPSKALCERLARECKLIIRGPIREDPPPEAQTWD